MEPTFDKDGYPTEASLEEVKRLANLLDFEATIEFMQALWAYPKYFRKTSRPHWEGQTKYARWHVSTGGWSGNEDVIHAVQDAMPSMFWMICWVSSRRGGHYVFDVPYNGTGMMKHGS